MKFRVFSKGFSLLFCLLFVITLLTPFVSAKEGDGWLCANQENVLGINMSPSGVTLVDSTNTSGYRRFNVLELFGSFGEKPVYYGEKAGNSSDFLAPQELSENRFKDAKIDEQALNKMVEARQLGNCTMWSNISSTGASIMLSIAYGFVYLARMFVSLALSPNFICSQQGQTGCLDIARIVGGDDANGGLVATFTSSIYFPLAFLSAMVAGVVIFYSAIIKRSVLAGLAQMVWVVLAFVVFGVMLSNPSLLARAPMALNNAVSSCVVSAVSGGGCSTSVAASNVRSQGSDGMCNGGVAEGKLDQQGVITASNLSCTVYKNLYLETVSQYVYGLSLSDLDTNTSNTVFSKAAKKAGIPLDRYCVPMGGVNPNGKNTNGLQLSGGRVCNAMVYQMYLQSGAKDSNGSIDRIGTNTPYFHNGISIPDKRWYNIIEPMTYIKGGWEVFSNQTYGSAGKLIMPVLASIVASLFSIMFAGMSTMFLFMSVVLLVFFPFFAVIGIEPTRGKFIFLSYAGMLASTLLKSILAGLFLLIYVLIMGSVMGATSSLAFSVMGLVTVSLGFYKYRKSLFSMFSMHPSGSGGVSSILNVMSRNKDGQNVGAFRQGVNEFVASNVSGNTMGESLNNATNEYLTNKSEQGSTMGKMASKYLNKQEVKDEGHRSSIANIDSQIQDVKTEKNVAASDLSRLNSIVDKLTAEQAVTISANNDMKANLSQRLENVHKLENTVANNIINSNNSLSEDSKTNMNNILSNRQEVESLKLQAASTGDEQLRQGLLQQARDVSIRTNESISNLSSDEKSVLREVDNSVASELSPDLLKPTDSEYKDLSISSSLLQAQTNQVKRLSKQRNASQKKYDKITARLEDLQNDRQKIEQSKEENIFGGRKIDPKGK